MVSGCAAEDEVDKGERQLILDIYNDIYGIKSQTKLNNELLTE